MTDLMSTSQKVLSILQEVSEIDEVGRNLDLELYQQDILDSMKTVELFVALGQTFGIEISPAEFERDHWATPRKIVAYMEQRVGP